ncbi:MULTISPECIES: metal-dependent transcriptional regulator [Arenibacter]|jgi:DtxR family Mn-dependent transcriptional regulator|uniref:Transcriptional regulator MntR n=1 Tax=Arenibacter algicola TaxID=616991 RepID=A0A221UXP4_9FLAO|nr:MULTISPECIES: metal-dependent transcriptional regulator [Arenibacter]ASO06030.1 iron-dependent repressor IdeR [Arenibacter algicola]MCK0137174.1 metal-dependent transcriptional regulator [Arenibacter sp. S6351L]MCK0189094.1 metal-dependent transcriptional regulator [Arenibacter sp. F20364]MDX1768120.1 metal-dependent transcriptional regulator [Arenibacter troitsensis]|tara:strand:+ start:5135 stop:5791 length:657 start_codon:yes stop_codon:yes gene_type:complete
MATKAKENYLKALYHLHLKNEEISLSELGRNLELSKPTVNNMVKKMHQNGWVKYEKYKPIKLTNEGRKNAVLVIRKHRLSEMFLSQIMGFGWEEVHDIAEELEHIKTENLFDRMDELLGFPNIDPHGSPIPNKEGEIVKRNYKTLAECSVGTKVELKALRDSSTDFLLFLNKKEIHLGSEILIHQIESFDKSMTISYGDHSEQVLSNSISSRILVEAI